MIARSQTVFVVLVGTTLVCFSCFQDQVRAAEPDGAKQSKAIATELQHIARLTAANELMRLHWTTWVSGKELRNIAQETALGINEQLGNRTDVEFLLPEVKAKPRKRDDFEKQAIEDIRAGVAEVWRTAPASVQYIRGLRATKTCVQCHQPIGTPSGTLNEGDLLGIISLKLKR